MLKLCFWASMNTFRSSLTSAVRQHSPPRDSAVSESLQWVPLSTNACLCGAGQPSLEESAFQASRGVYTAWRHMKTTNGTSHPSFLSLIISCLLSSYTWACAPAHRCYSTGNCSMTAIKQAPCHLQPGRMCTVHMVERVKGSPPACRVSAHLSPTGVSRRLWPLGTQAHQSRSFAASSASSRRPVQVPASLVFTAFCVGRCLPSLPVAKVLSWGFSVLFFTAVSTTREHVEGLQGQFPEEGPRDALHKPYNRETLCLASPAPSPEWRDSVFQVETFGQQVPFSSLSSK